MTSHYTPDIEAQGKLFYGRNAQLDAIFGRRWVWVCGQRRMGKSSLLLREAYRSETDDGWLAFYFLLHKVTGYDQADGHQFFSDFVKNVLGPKELDKHERPLDDEMQKSLRALGKDVLNKVSNSNRTPAQKFRYLVDRLQKRDQFRRVVFLWDEADGLLFFETNQKNRSPDKVGFLGEFHELFYSDDRFRLAVAGSQKFSALGNVPVPGGGNFLEPFRWMPLPGLEPGEARSLLLCENTAMWNPAIENKILDEAIRWSGGHPLILQKI